MSFGSFVDPRVGSEPELHLIRAGAIGAERALDGGTGREPSFETGKATDTVRTRNRGSAISVGSINRHLPNSHAPRDNAQLRRLRGSVSLVGSIAMGCMAVQGLGRHSDHFRYTSADTPIADKATNPAEFSVGPAAEVHVQTSASGDPNLEASRAREGPGQPAWHNRSVY